MNERQPLLVGGDDDVPPSHAPGKSGGLSLRSSVLNLVNAIVGGGVLALPFGFKRCGLILGAALVLVVALLSAYAGRLLLRARVLADALDADARSGPATYYRLVRVACGERAARAVELCVVALMLGACTGYVAIVGETLVHVVGATHGVLAHEWCIELLLLVGVMLPLSMLPSIEKLTFTSVIAVVGILFLVVCILVKSAANLGQALSDEDDKVLELATWSSGIFSSLPIFTFAFTMHIQLGHIWGDLRDPTPRRIRKVLYWAIAICALVYATVGAAGYLTWFDLTNENILTNYNSDTVIEVGKAAYATMVCFSFPLMMFPSRVAVAQQMRELLPPNIPIDRTRETRWQSFWVALVLCFFCYFAAVAIPNISVIFGLTGAIFGSVLVFIVPPILSIRLERRVRGSAHPRSHTVAAAALLVFGTCVGVLGVVTQFL